MNKLRLFLVAAVMSVLFVLCGTQAQAQATRTWVSGVGDDVNPCSRTAPCKTFQGAISKTAAGGEINTLDSGGFGGVTITKSITIVAEGVIGGVLVSGTNAIIVNAGDNDVITLRGLEINGLGTGLSGVRYLKGAQVNVEDCKIYGFQTSGIEVNLANTNVLPIAGRLTVKNTTITSAPTVGNNNTSVANTGSGISISAASGNVLATIDRVYLEGLNIGLLALTGTTSINQSVISQTTQQGVRAQNNAVINIENSLISNNVAGILAKNTSTIRVSNSSIFDNTTGISFGSGTVLSFGNNRLVGNATPGAFNASETLQ